MSKETFKHSTSVIKEMLKENTKIIEEQKLLKRFMTRKALTDNKFTQHIGMHDAKVKAAQELQDFLLEVLEEQEK